MIGITRDMEGPINIVEVCVSILVTTRGSPSNHTILAKVTLELRVLYEDGEIEFVGLSDSYLISEKANLVCPLGTTTLLTCPRALALS